MNEATRRGYWEGLATVGGWRHRSVWPAGQQRPVDAVQVGLSLIDYLDNRTKVAAWGEAGITVTIFEPLASGILSGKTLEQVRATWTGPWGESPFYVAGRHTAVTSAKTQELVR